jgi:Ca2+-binding EF-hand superfamily protein
MFSKDLNKYSRYRKLVTGGALLAGLIATTALGADTPAPGAAPTPPDGAPPCGRHGDIDLGKMKEHAAKMFAEADTNGDGKITVAEFLAFKPQRGGPMGHPGMGGPGGPGMGGPGMGMGGPGMGMMGMGHGGKPPTPQERDAQIQALETDVFKALDTDHNGQLSPAEFSKAHEVVHDVMAKQMFAKLDKNGDGVLTKDEFPPFVQKLSALDTNGDGTVSRDEMQAAHAAKGAQNGQTPN